MVDEKDVRLILNLNFPLELRTEVERAYKVLVRLSEKAVNINEGQPNEEIGFVELRLSGHRLTNIADEVISRREVGKRE